MSRPLGLRRIVYVAVAALGILAAPALVRTPTSVAAEPTQDLTGAVCAIDKTDHTICVVPWDNANKRWDKSGVRSFKLTPATIIVGETKGTVSELDAGKVEIKSAHLTGIVSGRVSGTPFEIKSVAQILHRRVTVSSVGSGDGAEASKLVLSYLFAGESLPAMVGNSGAQVFGDDVTIGCDR
jgi:hypothetical protein